jgi:hypothetical protein
MTARETRDGRVSWASSRLNMLVKIVPSSGLNKLNSNPKQLRCSAELQFKLF